MRKATMKIRSRRGASITFALLLFLVCAMASAVAIVSATAVSGRLAKIAETDQRYFAVNSAANMLKETLDGQAVKIICRTTTTASELYDTDNKYTGDVDKTEEKKWRITLDPNVTMDSAVSNKDVGSTAADGKVKIEKNKTLLVEASCSLENKKDGTFVVDGTPVSFPVSMDCTFNGTGTVTDTKIFDTLATKVYCKEPSGDSFDVYVSKGDEKLGYTLRMHFVADIQNVNNTETTRETNVAQFDDTTGAITGYKRKRTDVTTVTRTYKWQLVSINKDSLPASSTTPAGGSEGGD